VVGTGLSRAADRVIATDLDNPDFCALAEAYGAAGEAVTDTEAFGDALDRALKAGRPALLELRVDLEAIAPGPRAVGAAAPLSFSSCRLWAAAARIG